MRNPKLLIPVAGTLSLAVLVGCLNGKVPNGIRPDATGASSTQGSGSAISAAVGGVVMSADGTTSVTIPGGALTGDAKILIEPRDVAKGNSRLPDFEQGIWEPTGMAFNLQISDDVVIGRDQSLTVTQKTDPNFVAYLKAKDDAKGRAFDPNRYSLSQDAKGDWYMTMKVYGSKTLKPGEVLDLTQPIDPDTGLSETDTYLTQAEKARMNEVFHTNTPAAANPSYKLASTVDYTFKDTDGQISSDTTKTYKHSHSGSINWGLFGGYSDLEDEMGFNCGSPTCHTGALMEECARDWINWHGKGAKETVKLCLGKDMKVGGNCTPTLKPADLTVHIRWKCPSCTGTNGINQKYVKGADLTTRVLPTKGFSKVNMGEADGIGQLKVNQGQTIQYHAVWSKNDHDGDTNTYTDNTDPIDVDKKTETGYCDIVLPAQPKINFTAHPQGTSTVGSRSLKYTQTGGTDTILAGDQTKSITLNLGGTTTLTTCLYSPLDDKFVMAKDSFTSGTSTVYVVPTTTSVWVPWGKTKTINYNVVYTGKITGKAAYVSDDATVPADQRPATGWNAKAVGSGTPANVSYTFTHNTYNGSGGVNANTVQTVKPFSATATVDGVSGAAGNAKVTVVNSVVTLNSNNPTYNVGTSSTATVAGHTVTADLPAVKFRLVNDLPSDHSKLKLRYTLDDANGTVKTMSLAGTIVGSDGWGQVSLPVEDKTLDNPGNHTLYIKEIFIDTDNDGKASPGDVYRAVGTNSDGSFPPVGGFHRANVKQVLTIGSFDSVLLIPKYRSN